MTENAESDEAEKYSNTTTLSERATIAKETSLEQRADFLSNHAPSRFASNNDFAALLPKLINEEVEVPVTIVVADIRGSTDLMRNSVYKGRYASIVTSFIEESKEIITREEHGGWFDTFTGDGFVSYWLPDAYAEIEDLDELEVIQEKARVSNEILPCLIEIFKCYINRIDPLFIENAQNMSTKTGLSFGIDSGPGVFVPTPSASRITLIGDPYVGAVRAESNAPPYTIALNVRPGKALYDLRDQLKEEYNMEITQAVVENKDFPDGKIIYLLKSNSVDELLNDKPIPIRRSRKNFVEEKGISEYEDGFF